MHAANSQATLTARGRTGGRRGTTATAALLVLVLALTTMVGTTTSVAGAASVTSTAPPDGLFGEPYAHTFTTDLVDASWSVTSGTLPGGVTLAPATGELTGSPTQVGGFGPVTVTASAADPYEQISARQLHNCALTETGVADCWGYSSNGQAADQPGPYVAIAAGYLHSCALVAATGAADCWGSNTAGQSADQTGPYTDIAAGDLHTCTLTTTGSADCWGANNYGQSIDQAGPYAAIAAGANHTCALVAATGAADCWGFNNAGQAIDQTGPYIAITAGRDHTCALTATGAADCWGGNLAGQATDQTGPYSAIDAGVTHTCALVESTGAADCWGNNTNGQATDQTGPYTAIAAGTVHTCAVTTGGDVDCWGTNSNGEATDQTAPTSTADQTFSLTVRAKPSITPIGDQSLVQDTSSAPLTFLVADEDHTSLQLATSASSSNQTVIPDGNLVVSGIGASRSLTVTPAAGQTGSATVTVTVTDPDGLVGSASFSVTVTPTAGAIAGTVTAEGSGTPLAGVQVLVWSGTTKVAKVTTAADGTYTVPDLAPGTQYRLRYRDLAGDHLTEYNDDATRFADAPGLTVTSGATTTADAALTPYAATAAITGVVDHRDTGLPLQDITITVWRDDVAVAGTVTDTFGSFRIDGLDPTGTWKLRYRDATGTLQSEYWLDQGNLTNATPIPLTASTLTTLDATLHPRGSP